MNPFPEEWELLGLFEAEPSITDRDVPWFYNCLTFETTRGDEHVRCKIEPACGTIVINWWQKRTEKMSLELHLVDGLQVVTGGGIDYMVVNFRDRRVYNLEFHLKPQIKLRWGTSPE